MNKADEGAAALASAPERQLDSRSAFTDLSCFVSWGGPAAVELMRAAITEFIGDRLDGQHVLDIGAGPGKTSALFALMGAEVTGVDGEPGFAGASMAEARKWGVEDRVRFVEYDGHPSSLPAGAYDLAFHEERSPIRRRPTAISARTRGRPPAGR